MVEDITKWVVLVVDNEPDNVQVVAEILGFNGAQVHTALSAAEGLQKLTELTPSFILLDLSMPEMDGWTMFKSIRANPSTGATPIIALTAHAMEGDRAKVMEYGFNGYIAKPFRLINFVRDIQACLEQTTMPDKNL